MKLTIILLTAVFLNVHAAGISQEITFSGKNVSLKKVFAAIENQTRYSVVYEGGLLRNAGHVSIAATKQPLEKFLESVLSSQSLAYTIENTTIIISRKPRIAGLSSRNSSLSSVPPPFEVKGTVLDANGQPLSGVNVLVKGTKKGTVTDEAGKFSLNLEPADVLIISYTGYETQEIPVESRSEIKVTMKVSLSSLTDVVVVGYTTQKRADLTGAVASVKSKDLVNLPATDLSTALQGRIPGAYISTVDGNPNSGSAVIIRGPLSINGGEPLYVVDGVPFQGTGLNFNIQDIESIDVLKDASAAAIYGYRAAGGVILVKTKRGNSKRFTIGLNSSVGARRVFGLPQTLQRDEYIAAKKAFGFNVEDLYGPESGWSTLPNTNWFDALYRTGVEQNHVLSLTGGNEISNFYMSANYGKIQGTRVGNSLERYSFRINSEHKVGSRVKIGQTLYGSFVKEDPDRSNQGAVSFRTTPVMNIYDTTNPYGNWGKAPKGFQGINEVYAALGNYTLNQNYSVLLTINGEVQIAKGLVLGAVFGTGLNGSDNYNYEPQSDVGTAVFNESFGKSLSKGQNFIATYTLNYAKAFGEHSIRALAGYEARRSNYSDIGGGNRDPLVPRPQSFSLVVTDTTATVGGSNANVFDRVLSQFGRVEYSYSDKYLLTATIRRDGLASKFGPNNRYGIFPGLSAGWRISEEDFMSSVEQISDLKLRAGYGLLGNSVGADFAFSPAYSTGYTADLGGGRLNSVNIINRLPNPDIKWESVRTLNIGLDVGLLQNKVLVNLDYYDRQTKDMIYNVGIAASSGLGGSVPANIGQMSNKGFEFNIEYNNRLKKDFSYSISFNGGTNKNRLISLNPALGKLFITNGNLTAAQNFASTSRSEPGRELGHFYGYQVLGIYTTDAAAGEKRPTINGGYAPVPGDLIYKDINGDGEINADDRTYIGSPWPKFTYGLNLKLAWKTIDFTAFLNGVYGSEVYNAFETYEHIFFSDYTTTAGIFKTSGFNGSGITNVPRVGTINDYDKNLNWLSVNSYHVQNGSYLRLRNVELGYSLPASLLQKWRISSIRFFASATNLFTITKYKGINPDIGIGGFLDKGIDNANLRYPVSRIYSFGLNAAF